MNTLSVRLEPRIAYGVGPSQGAFSAPLIKPPTGPTELEFPDNPATGVTMLMSIIGDLSDDHAMKLKFERLFDFAPILPETMHPLVFAGGEMPARRRALRALGARLRRMGRETRLLALEPLVRGDEATNARDRAGFTTVSSAAALMRLIRERPDDVLDLIDTSMPLDCEGSVGTLAHLREAANVEVILFADGRRLVPSKMIEGACVNRFVLGCRIDEQTIESVLELGYGRAWAFAGISCMPGVFRDVEAGDLAERVGAALLSGGFGIGAERNLNEVEIPNPATKAGPPLLGSASR